MRPRICARRRFSTSLNELLGPHIFPPKEDGSNPRACPSCGNGQLSLKLGKFGAFIGCSNYPECKFTRTLADTKAESLGDSDRPGVKVLGEDPETRRRDHVARRPLRHLCAAGRRRETETLVAAEDAQSVRRDAGAGARAVEPAARGCASIPRPKRRSSPASAVTGLMSSTARPTRTSARTRTSFRSAAIAPSISSSPRKAAFRAGASAREASSASRELGDHPQGGAVVIKAGRFGPYVNWGKINATLPRDSDPTTLTLDEAIALLAAKAQGGGGADAGPRARAASVRRRYRSARGPLRTLCQPRQDQCDLEERRCRRIRSRSKTRST